ncbi:MAG TPA: nuclear transport factor 2 family protein [Actinomycetota bacterium]|nr:nuclear transport factor 2 family protein [Actinomycetota bacterium]
MDRPTLQRWLDDYVEAWRSNDAPAIGELFSADAEYRYHPADEPVFGRDAIIASWLAEPDEPGTWDAWYEPFAVEGERGVATGVSTYFDADGKPDRVYDNVFVTEFDKEGRCRVFTEWFRQRPETDPTVARDATDV